MAYLDDSGFDEAIEAFRDGGLDGLDDAAEALLRDSRVAAPKDTLHLVEDARVTPNRSRSSAEVSYGDTPRTRGYAQRRDFHGPNGRGYLSFTFKRRHMQYLDRIGNAIARRLSD